MQHQISTSKPEIEDYVEIEDLKEAGLIKITRTKKVSLITTKDLLKRGLIKEE